MGQYHYCVNLDKHEFLHPHNLGDGLKLVEQAHSGKGGITTALHILLAVSNGRGGGDYPDGIEYGYAEKKEDVPKGATLGYDSGKSVSYTVETPLKKVADEVIGRWGGDRIAIIGDYAEAGDISNYPIPAPLIYELCDRSGDGVRNAIEWRDEQIARLADDERVERTQLEREKDILANAQPFIDISDLVRDYMAPVFRLSYQGDGWAQRKNAEGKPQGAAVADMVAGPNGIQTDVLLGDDDG